MLRDEMREFVANTLKIPADEVSDATSLESVDSLDMIDMVLGIENKFDIEIVASGKDEQWHPQDFRTFGDLWRAVDREKQRA